MNFELARFNMVEQQIRPWDIHDPILLDLMATIPRERFIPNNLQSFAFADTALPFTNNSQIPAPIETAKLLQGLNIQPNDRVLEIGIGCGYQSALIANLTRDITVMDADQQHTNAAKAIHTELAIHNIRYLDDTDELAQHYDVILVNTVLDTDTLQHVWLPRLADKGRLAAVTGQAPAMSANVYMKYGQHVAVKTLFETDRTLKSQPQFNF